MKLCMERTDRFFFKMGGIAGIGGDIGEESKKLGSVGEKDDDESV